MSEQLEALFNESVSLELKVAELYDFFGKLFSEDSQFWVGLSIEERNHASLIQSGRDSFWPAGKFPVEMLGSNLDDVIGARETVEEILSKSRKKSPTRHEALNIAYTIECSAGETHYQLFMAKKAETKIEKIFHRLNNDDKDHADRILKYMNEHGIELQPIAS